MRPHRPRTSRFSLRFQSVAKFVSFVLFTLLYVYFTYNAMPKRKTTSIKNKNITWKIMNGLEYNNVDPYAGEERMVSRREHLNSGCLRYSTHHGAPNLTHFVLDGHHGLVWCSLPAAADRLWLHYFALLGGYSDDYVRKSDRSRLTLVRAQFPVPTGAQLEQALAEGALTFIVVRDPLERLLATYLTLTDATPHGTAPPFSTFVQFVQHVLHHRGDQQWATVYQLCAPCFVNFTAILKVETLLEDQEYIVRRAGLEDILNLSKLRLYYLLLEKGRMSNLLAEHYGQLPFSLIYDLINMYQIDYDLFGYNVTKYFTYFIQE